MRVKCTTVMEGPGPSEKVVAIDTSAGTKEEVVVHESLTDGKSVQVARIGQQDNRVLVELPRESANGHWRIWVQDKAMV